MKKVNSEHQLKEIFTPDIFTENKDIVIPSVPIAKYNGFIRPADDKNARKLGDSCINEIILNKIGDFERSRTYCCRKGEQNSDLMVHVSTFVIIEEMIYMTYYANTVTSDEDPCYHEARLAICPLENPGELTVLTLQKAGDEMNGLPVTRLYDTILLYKGGDEIFLMWTAAIQDNYYRLYRTFNIRTCVLGPIQVNRFKLGEAVNDFSSSGIISALAYNAISHTALWSDIGIMQKLSSRVENGETYYYTGAYSGNFNCIIKSKDLITWEYVAAPDFPNNSKWENAVYLFGDKCYYFVRQQECSQGFLTYYDLESKEWAVPALIADAQSRSDFICYKNSLYLIHAPIDRNGFGMIKINTDDISRCSTVLVADMKDSLFYPYLCIYEDTAYISYTVNRKHIRLSRFNLKNYIKD